MNIGYIEESNKSNILKYYFNIIDTKEEDNKKIYSIPKKGNTIKENFKSLINKIKLDKISMVILCDELKENKRLKNILINNNIKIINGRYLFKWIIVDIIEYIAKKQNLQIENEEITVLINNIENKDIQNIILIAKQCKRINLITNKIEKLRKLEEYLQTEFGIILNLYSLDNTQNISRGIIVNFDFNDSTINKLKIEQNQIIINVLKQVRIKSKKFNGININYYKLNCGKMNKKILNELEYEAKIYREYDFNSIRELINKDKIEVEYLIGNRGKISDEEFIRLNT